MGTGTVFENVSSKDPKNYSNRNLIADIKMAKTVFGYYACQHCFYLFRTISNILFNNFEISIKFCFFTYRHSYQDPDPDPDPDPSQNVMDSQHCFLKSQGEK
jgi:hypothetical protein